MLTVNNMKDRLYPTGHKDNVFFTLNLNLPSNFFCAKLIKVNGDYYKADLITRMCLVLIKSLPDGVIFKTCQLRNYLGCNVDNEIEHLIKINAITLENVKIDRVVHKKVAAVANYEFVIDRPKGFYANSFKVYRLFYENNLVYVGRTLSSLDQRLKFHRKDRKQFDYVDYCEVINEQMMINLEGTLINKFKPLYNTVIPVSYRMYKGLNSINWQYYSDT